MLISVNWIKDFVDLPEIPAKELGSKFTLATAEVEDVITKGESLKPILCVEIKSLRPHPEADKLNLVTFDYGSGKIREVVCGAPNVRPGLKVPYAPIGTTLPNGMTLEPKKIRGILSDGMLCSEVELGLGEGKAGLMELDSKVVPGTPLKEHLNVESDVILDVDNKSLTHRPDLWGMLGLAREFSAVFGNPLKNRFTEDWQKGIEPRLGKGEAPVKVEVHPDSSCLAYFGLSLDGVKMRPTPDWMKSRLETVGLRSINLVVDISNYVMVELGIPNHIFDRDKIQGGRVVIRRPTEALEFQTLDEIKRDILPSDTMIFDAERPLVLAGLMGGLESGVTDDTSRIFLEVANWEAPEVRKTSVRLGLRTDSSQRYEKTLDSNLCYRSLLRLVELLQEHIPELTVAGSLEKYINESKLSRELTLEISHDFIIRSLGMDLTKDRIQGIFHSLDFKVNLKEETYRVTVPTYRTTKDISCKADLVEEIGRLIGYDNISPVSPLMEVRPVRLSHAKQFHRKLQDFLVFNGECLEVMTYPLTGADLLKKAHWPVTNEKLVLLNSLSVEQDRMRPSLIPAAIELAATNQKNFDSFSFFEIGRSYLGYEQERSQLLVGYYSKDESQFLKLINTTEKLLASLNIPYNLVPKNEKFANPVLPSAWEGLHPHEYLNVQIMGKFAGALNTVHPLVLKSFKMKGHLSIAVLDITELESREMKDKTKYQPTGKFPTSSSDFTVVMDKSAPAASAIWALNALKQKELKSKALVDVFIIDDLKKAVSLRTVFEDSEKTLSPETIKDLEQKIIQTLEKAGLMLRS